MVFCCKLWEKCDSHQKQYCYFWNIIFYCNGFKTLPWNDMVCKITQTVKPQQKKKKKKTGKWSKSKNVVFRAFHCQNWFFRTRTFASLIYLISSSHNFVRFLSKTDKVVKKSYFFADFEMFTIIWNFWT